ncbi:uncharacterized protein LTR77_002544 [Saxophila tyrrhenica]|uniref:NAD(P)-binding protein n=1 Tax=Saxophila tyrrhenica TaxID=1690608 RepID=A0AAV9PMF0_9PEZI|nr:hypothetical protein LTR77_002544 [Saxophila tyrrhenica]
MDSPVALITGGGSGIGLAVAEHLINLHGYRVAILDIDEQRVKLETETLGSSRCLGLHVDITDYNQQARAFKQTFEWGGNRLDLFFANAGIGDSDSMYKDMFGLDDETGLPKPLNLCSMDVNMNAVLQGMHIARHIFTEKNQKPGGKIIASSSVVGIYPNYAMPLYCASKHGLVGLVRALAPVYAKDNISVNCLCPTLIETNLMPKHMVREFHVPAETTPMSTALRAIDRVVQDNSLTGQVMELTLDEVVFKHKPEYSRPNVKWMFDQMEMWERVCEPVGLHFLSLQALLTF